MPEHVDLAGVDIDELASAMQDQEDYEHWWTFDPRTGEFGYRSRYDDDYGPDELPDPDVLVIHPYPSHVWYRDMVDFAEELTDERTSRRLLRALDGRGAFRHFKNELYEEYPRPGLERLAGVPDDACPPPRRRVAPRRGPRRGVSCPAVRRRTP